MSTPTVATCATCAHWERNTKDDPGGSFASLAHGECGLGYTEYGYEAVTGTLAVALDAEGYRGYLKTHESYGCVQWQAREETP